LATALIADVASRELQQVCSAGQVRYACSRVAKNGSALVSIVAERDIVILSFARENPEPQDVTRKYMIIWFDIFRVENGKIVEHWDGAVKPPTP
jgi:predicted SnoaL-like aldol condensation-catalyzing enzyme